MSTSRAKQGGKSPQKQDASVGIDYHDQYQQDDAQYAASNEHTILNDYIQNYEQQPQIQSEIAQKRIVQNMSNHVQSNNEYSQNISGSQSPRVARKTATNNTKTVFSKEYLRSQSPSNNNQLLSRTHLNSNSQNQLDPYFGDDTIMMSGGFGIVMIPLPSTLKTQNAAVTAFPAVVSHNQHQEQQKSQKKEIRININPWGSGQGEVIENNKNSSMANFDTARDDEDFMMYAGNYKKQRSGVKTSSNILHKEDGHSPQKNQKVVVPKLDLSQQFKMDSQARSSVNRHSSPGKDYVAKRGSVDQSTSHKKLHINDDSSMNLKANSSLSLLQIFDQPALTQKQDVNNVAAAPQIQKKQSQTNILNLEFVKPVNESAKKSGSPMRQTQRPTNASVAANKSPSGVNNAAVEYTGSPAIINLNNDPIRDSNRDIQSMQQSKFQFTLQAFSPRNIHKKVNYAMKKNHHKGNTKTSPNQDLLAVQVTDEKKHHVSVIYQGSAATEAPLTTIGSKPIYMKHPIVKPKLEKVPQNFKKQIKKEQPVVPEQQQQQLQQQPFGLIEGANGTSRQSRIEIPQVLMNTGKIMEELERKSTGLGLDIILFNATTDKKNSTSKLSEIGSLLVPKPPTQQFLATKLGSTVIQSGGNEFYEIKQPPAITIGFSQNSPEAKYSPNKIFGSPTPINKQAQSPSKPCLVQRQEEWTTLKLSEVLISSSQMKETLHLPPQHLTPSVQNTAKKAMEKTQVLSKVNHPISIVEIGFSGDLNEEQSMTNLNQKILSPKSQVKKVNSNAQQTCDLQTLNSENKVAASLRQQTGPLKSEMQNRLGPKSKSSVRRSKAFQRRISADAADNFLLGNGINDEHNAVTNIVNIQIDPNKQQSMVYVAGAESPELKSLPNGTFVQGKTLHQGFNNIEQAGSSFHTQKSVLSQKQQLLLKYLAGVHTKPSFQIQPSLMPAPTIQQKLLHNQLAQQYSNQTRTIKLPVVDNLSQYEPTFSNYGGVKTKSRPQIISNKRSHSNVASSESINRLLNMNSEETLPPVLQEQVVNESVGEEESPTLLTKTDFAVNSRQYSIKMPERPQQQEGSIILSAELQNTQSSIQEQDLSQAEANPQVFMNSSRVVLFSTAPQMNESKQEKQPEVHQQKGGLPKFRNINQNILISSIDNNDVSMQVEMLEGYEDVTQEEREIIKQEVSQRAGRCQSQMVEANEAYQLYGSVRAANQVLMGYRKVQAAINNKQSSVGGTVEDQQPTLINIAGVRSTSIKKIMIRSQHPKFEDFGNVKTTVGFAGSQVNFNQIQTGYQTLSRQVINQDGVQNASTTDYNHQAQTRLPFLNCKGQASLFTEIKSSHLHPYQRFKNNNNNLTSLEHTPARKNQTIYHQRNLSQNNIDSARFSTTEQNEEMTPKVHIPRLQQIVQPSSLPNTSRLKGGESKLNFLLGNKGLLVDEGSLTSAANNSYFTGERRTAFSMINKQDEAIPAATALGRKPHLNNPSHKQMLISQQLMQQRLKLLHNSSHQFKGIVMHDSTSSFAYFPPQQLKNESKMVILGVKKDRTKQSKNKMPQTGSINDSQTLTTKLQAGNSIEQMNTHDYDNEAPTPDV